jgi:hypothetical protein
MPPQQEGKQSMQGEQKSGAPEGSHYGVTGFAVR